MKCIKIVGLIILAMTVTVGCNSNSSDKEKAGDEEKSQETELTDFEMTNGIGPVDEEITIEEVDQELAEKGEQIFDMKCSACHKMDSRYVGPPLAGVSDTRTPAFIMNMILNPAEMIDKHPIAKALMNEYLTPMPNQNLSREEARAVVEYLSTNPE